MAIHTWYLLALVLASVGASVYDQGPQTFFESSSPSPQLEQAAREFVLYLTPNQAKALETSGAVVRPQYDTEAEQAPVPQVVEQAEPQYDDNNSEEYQKEDADSELEEIFKILNQQKTNEQLEQREEEKTTEKPRETPAPFKVIPKFQQDDKKYYAPAGAKKNGAAKSYSYVRFLHPVGETENQKLKPYRAQPLIYFEKNQDSTEQPEEKSSEEVTESEKQKDNIASLLQHQKITAHILEHRDRLLKNELELNNKLRDLQDAPKHNDQKYSIQIENLRSNLEKQNALFKAEALAKAAPLLIKEEISVKPRRPVEAVKHVKGSVSSPVLVRVPQHYAVPVKLVRPVPLPYAKTEKIEAPKPDSDELEKRVPGTKNVYVKVNKPYLLERIHHVADNREVPEEVRTRKPEELTIVRHIWEH